jgi:hypothetical protein
VLSLAPVGVVNLRTWLERVLTFEDDMVSERAVSEAACATLIGPMIIESIATTKPKLVITRNFSFKFLIILINFYAV